MDSNYVYEDDNIDNDCDEDEANNDDYKDAGAAVENYIADHWGKERGHGSIYSIYTFWERGGGRIVAGSVSSGDEEFEVHRCMLSNS